MFMIFKSLRGIVGNTDIEKGIRRFRGKDEIDKVLILLAKISVIVWGVYILEIKLVNNVGLIQKIL